MKHLVCVSRILLLIFAAPLLAAPDKKLESNQRLIFDSVPTEQFEFAGPVGKRVGANIENWLLRAPQSNPGIIEMFRARDRKPAPQLVPWAGEFIGKYLISAVQALRMTRDPRLFLQVSNVVEAFIATQSEDGYLGPFPKDGRLLGNWDLWGHYYAISALMLWHQQTGDPTAMAAAHKAADLICKTYLDGDRRVLNAGDPGSREMNMAILTGMAMLHRITGEPRYLRMAREVEKDWESAGDYLRSGLDGREFFRSPRPRWESLVDLQGLAEMWRITGDTRYREAFEHHWRSLRRWDCRNTGGFSSGEQATGNPFAPTAIETCSTVAWMALTIDYLRLTGDCRAADDLELATLNGGLGAQSPSGCWWTYNTPMDGVREASAHSIVFQARAGTPELNCCSVNGPRVLGMLTEWSVMSATNGLVVNWLGAGTYRGQLADGAPVTITSSGDAWRDGYTELRVLTRAKRRFALRVRIPGWARDPRAQLNGATVPDAVTGKYLVLDRVWAKRDRLELNFILPLRFVAGANESAGKVSLYRGPVLLTFDQAENGFDEDALPAVALERLMDARVIAPSEAAANFESCFCPWLMVEVPSVKGPPLRLVDFASAGARGTRYQSWLPASPEPCAPAITETPADAARVPPGPMLFRWRGPRSPEISCRVEFSCDETFSAGAGWFTNVTGEQAVVDSRSLSALTGTAGSPIFWRVATSDTNGETIADVPPAWFRILPGLPKGD